MRALLDILKDTWNWRSQIWNLGLFDLQKTVRGSVLGPVWLFMRPAVYICVFWFALQIGLKSGGTSSGTGAPYILWLMGGLIPWFYMQQMIGEGTAVFATHSYLVTKIRFPLAGVPAIFAVATGVVQVGLIVVLFVVYFAFGQPPSIYLLQIPVAFLLMVAFFDFFSLMTSCLSAVSKDFRNFMKTLSTPLFWLSGIIYDVFALDYNWLTTLLMFDPITFIASMYRAAVYDGMWIWQRPGAVECFAAVFVFTVVCATLMYARTREEVPDVI